MNEAITDWLFGQVPIWLVAVLVFALLMCACEIGARLPWRGAGVVARVGQAGFIVSAVLGLLALLIGFTFSMAIERYAQRQTLVLDEANAIATAFLSAQAVAEPHRSEMGALLVAYVDNRLALGRSRDSAETRRLLAQTDALQARLWAATLTAVDGRDDAVAAMLLGNMNHMFSVSTARQAAWRIHVPLAVFAVLLVYMSVSASILGHALGGSRRAELGVFLALLTMSYLLILDIDGPRRGGVVEFQEPMVELRASMGRTL